MPICNVGAWVPNLSGKTGILSEEGCLPGLARSRRPRFSSTIARSEEHTSELQSHLNLVCRLLLEKKKAQRCTQPRPHSTLLTTTLTDEATCYPCDLLNN